MVKETLEKEVFAEIVEMLFRTVPVAIITLALTAGLLAYLQWDYVDHGLIQGWVAAVVILILVRLAIYLLYGKSGRAYQDKERWGKYNFYAVGCQGLVWGAGFALLYPQDNIEHQYLVVLYTMGVASGAASTLNVWPKCMLFFVTPVLFMPVPVYLLYGNSNTPFIVLGIFLLYFYFIRNGFYVHAMTRQNIMHRLETSARERDLNASRQRRLDITEQMVANSSNIEFYIDADQVYQIVNNSYLAFFGKTREYIIGRRMKDAMPAAFYEREIRPAVEDCLAGNRHYRETWIRGGDGKQHFMAVTMDPHKDADGNILGVVVSATDISKLKQSEQESRKSWELFLAALSATPEAVSIHNLADRKIRFVNPAFEELMGYSGDQLVGATTSDLKMWVIESDLQRFMDTFRREGRIRHFQTLARHRNGHSIPVSITAMPFQQEDESCYVSWIEDRREALNAEAERHKLEIQLSQARKMEAIGQLTGGIAHDFNNILQAILGYCQLAKMTDEAELNTELASYLDYIEHGGQRAQDMIKQLMLFSRSAPQERSLQSLTALVTNVLQLLKPSISASITINTDLPDDLDKVLIDPVQFEQIVMNLCINARDAIEGTGTIDISLREVEQDGTVCDSCQESFHGRFVELAVKDSGSGIDAEIMTSIFDPFFSTKEVGNGTGLGLSTVHGAIHNHGGHVLVTSTPGQGTAFRLLFPHGQAPDDAARKVIEVQDAPAPTAASESTPTIMIVDDEKDITAYLSKLLRMRGYATRTFNNSEQALAGFRQASADIDLVITDQTMPGLTGLALAEAIHRVRQDVPVIICSGNLTDLNMIAEADAGIAAYLTKPINSTLLLDKLAQILG